MSETATDRDWWKEAVFYQIYPRSFSDSDGDGIGDLAGIVEHVPYLEYLGVDCIWLCPVYDSPQNDNGYDISDFRSIDDTFGDMADFEALLDALDERDIRLVMDLVLNHTSDEHEWFQKSRRREGEYEDYYYWRDGDPDEPPNNWESIFGGSAWKYDDLRGQWYLHLFDESQPDLNWRNPAVRESMRDLTRWWLEKGIDGFRMDAVTHMSKVDGLPDGDPAGALVGSEHFTHGPRLEEYLSELTELCNEYNAVSIAEMGSTTIEQAAHYGSTDGPGIHLPFQFDHVHAGYDPADVFKPDVRTEWDFTSFKETIARQQREIPWNAVFFANHDLPRSITRMGDETYRRESATLIATCLLTLPGTPFLYQGDEIGMTNVEFEDLTAVDDPKTVTHIEELVADGILETTRQGLDLVNTWSRDHSRTPMQWSDEDNAGFTDGEPWLPVNENYREVNVEAARGDDRSVLQYYRDLIELRHADDVFVYGEFELLLPDDEQVFAYCLERHSDCVLVVLNFSDAAADGALPDGVPFDDDHTLLQANYDDARGREPLDLRPWEARVYRIAD